MRNAIDELKTRAGILQAQIRKNQKSSLSRLRSLPQFRRSSEAELASFAPEVQRRHCLSILAAEMGLPGWPDAKRLLGGEGPVANFGDILYPERCCMTLTNWFTRYEEAAAVQESAHGYLLAYRRQYFIADRYFVESLGLDPDDPDWREIGFDWVRPGNLAARNRLYDRLIAALPAEGNVE